MFEDKIVKGGEITETGIFKLDGSTSFYLFIVPKAEDTASTALLNVKLSRNNTHIVFPFCAGYWSPVVVNEVDVKSGDLSSYRIFWGETL